MKILFGLGSIGLLFSVVSLCVFIPSCIVQGYRFDTQCAGYLDRAAHSNTPELALENLGFALDWCERNGTKTGTTNVLFSYPENDVGYWFKNLCAARDELKGLGPNANDLTKSNVLIRVRETLMAHGEHSDVIRAPSGISVFPNNSLYLCWVLGSLASLVFGALGMIAGKALDE